MNFSILAQSSAMMDANLEVIAESEPTPGWLVFKENLNTTDTTIFEDYKSNFSLGSKDEMVLLSSVADKYGFTHNYYQQTYQEIPVESGHFRIQSNLQNNTVWKGNGRIVKGINANPIPNLNNAKAVVTAIEYIDAEVYAWEVDESYTYPTAELLIIQSGEDNILAYKVDVYTSVPFGGQAIYVNAQNGNIEKTVSLYNGLCVETEELSNCTASVNQDVNNWFFDFDVCIKTTEEDGVFKLKDLCRELYQSETKQSQIETRLSNSFDPTGLPVDDSFVFYIDENNPPSNNDIVKDAFSMHFAVERAYDYFKNLGAMFLDHDDRNLIARVRGSNIASQTSIGVNESGVQNIDPIVHEFTHFIARNKMNPLSHGVPSVSLGIEESFCDILGVMTDYTVRTSFGETTLPDYHVATAGRDFSKYQSLVYNNDGSVNTQLSNYNYYTINYYAIGGVHSHWFYLLSEGGKGLRIDNSTPISGGMPIGGSYNICPIGFELATDIVFNNYYFEQGQMELNFDNVRQGSLSVLENMEDAGYFTTEEEYLNAVRQVTNAWYAVNVGEPYNGETENNVEITGDLGICHGESTTLTASAGYASYSWSTGETTQVITVNEEGTYIVELGSEDNEGNAYCDAMVSVDVFFTPFVDLRGDENGEATFCLGKELNAGEGNGLSYQWSTGETTQKIAPQSIGVYTVTVTEGNCSNTDEINITHLWQATIDASNAATFIQGSEYFYCDFDSSPLVLSLNGDFEELRDLTWYDVIEDKEIGKDILSISITEPGRYRVDFSELNSSSDGLCTVSDEITILGEIIEHNTTVPNSLNICSEDNFGIDINDYFTGAQEYTIYPPNQGTPVHVDEEGLKDYSVTKPGEYKITGKESYCGSEFSHTFNVNLTDLTVTIDIEGDEPYCGRATLTANSSSEDVTYQWFPSSINTGEKSITVENTANYRVRVTSQGNQNCTVMSDPLPVTIRPVPAQPSFTSEDLIGECGKKLELVSISIFDRGTWFLDGEVVGQGQSLTVKTPGTYTAQVTTSHGCVSPLSTPTTITMNDLMPEVDFVQAETDTDTWNDTFEGASTTTTMTSFTWNVNTGPDQILGTLVVPEGVELNISNKTITFLDEYSGISVKEGGRLRLNKATLQAHECSGMNWKGIQVKGKRSEPHETWYSNPNSSQLHPDHGIVIVNNQSIIRDAMIGIHAYAVTDVVVDPISGAISDIGGGFVHIEKGNSPLAKRNQFVNNKVGIQIEQHDAVQRSLITDTDFINDAPFPNASVNAWAGEYKHIILNRASRNIDGQVDGGLHIYGNDFSTDDDSDLNGVARGIGIVAIQTNITIGSEENNSFEPNEFTNLDKGIDIYSTASLMNVTNVINNQFYNNHHAITLNTTPTAIVSANYIELPTVATENYPAHGIFIKQSFALKMEGNRLVSKDDMLSSNPSINQVKGIVFQDCFKDGELDSHIEENRFEGAIGAGTQFEGNSQGIQLFCNKYLEDGDTGEVPLNDWYLPKESESGTAMGANTIINAQGDCNGLNGVFDMFWQDWHTTNNFQNRRHIYNLAAHTVELNYGGIESKPTEIDGADDGVDDADLDECTGGSPLNKTICDEVFIAPPNDDGIVYTTPIYPPNPPHPPRPTGQCELTTKDIQYLLAIHQVNEVLMDLACLNEIWSNKLLVNTYAANDDEQTARFYLNRIPQSTAENVEFHQLYEAVWGGQIHQVESISNNIVSSNAALAQAHLVVLRGDIYSRKSTPLEENHNSSKRNSNILESQQGFTIYPNPGNTLIHVNWKGTGNALFHIYDMNGQLIFSKPITQNENSVDIEDLQAGIYYCRMQDIEEVEKLVIIR
ncbi:MAG: T9SS type A sorting domain-containing protein [Chitinophagales bacterium]